VCGHLDTDVCALADELLAEPAPCEARADELEQHTEAFEYAPASAE
jgi:hypothetical protein